MIYDLPNVLLLRLSIVVTKLLKLIRMSKTQQQQPFQMEKAVKKLDWAPSLFNGGLY